MSMVIKSIEVDVPVSTAFEDWTRFEELPWFMRGVVAVKQLDDRHLHWRVRVRLMSRPRFRLEVLQCGRGARRERSRERRALHRAAGTL